MCIPSATVPPGGAAGHSPLIAGSANSNAAENDSSSYLIPVPARGGWSTHHTVAVNAAAANIHMAASMTLNNIKATSSSATLPVMRKALPAAYHSQSVLYIWYMGMF